jgi:microcin C transport system substrate-binding protein
MTSPGLAHDAEGEGPSDHHAVAARLVDRAEAEDDRHARPCVSGRSARATCRCSSAPADLFARLLRSRPFEESTLDVPLGSGPYKVGRFEAGRYIEYERVKDWWGATCRCARAEQFRYRCATNIIATATWPSRASPPSNYLFREEFTSRIWATRYDFPAIKDGRVKREVLPDETPSGAQGWFINTRRAKFKDPRVREALILRLRFRMDQPNHHVRLVRAHAFGVPELGHDGGRQAVADELALLEPFRGKVPDEVFGEPFLPPVTDGSGQDRRLLRRATQLAARGRLHHQGRRRVNRAAKRITIEFLIEEPTFQPHHMPFIKNLATLGIERQCPARRLGAVSARRSTTSISTSWCSASAFRRRRAIRCAILFRSQAAAIKGSQNLAGIADPAIDALIERIIEAKDRRRTHLRLPRARPRDPRRPLLDPALVQGSHWIAYWDVFERPAEKPRYARGIPETWWAIRKRRRGPEPGCEPFISSRVLAVDRRHEPTAP